MEKEIKIESTEDAAENVNETKSEETPITKVTENETCEIVEEVTQDSKPTEVQIDANIETAETHDDTEHVEDDVEEMVESVEVSAESVKADLEKKKEMMLHEDTTDSEVRDLGLWH